MNSKLTTMSLRLLVILITLPLCAEGKAASHEQFALDLSAIGIAAHERIVGFDIKLHGGRIATVADIPLGWAIKIENSGSWDASVDGRIEVGAAAQASDFIRNAIVVEKSELQGLEAYFSGSVYVSENMDQFRTIVVPRSVSFIRLPTNR